MNQTYTKQFESLTLYNQPLFETDNFKVVPSLGSLVEGWLLIVPKKHYLSFGYLEKNLFNELSLLHNFVVNSLESIYNKGVISFENGTFNHGSCIGCGVDYAHIHYVPIEVDIKQLIDEFYNFSINWEKANSLLSLKNPIENHAPYIFIENNYRERFICEITTPHSQLIRKLIAKQIGMPEKYDWKKYFFEENIKKTIEKFEVYSSIKQMKEFQFA